MITGTTWEVFLTRSLCRGLGLGVMLASVLLAACAKKEGGSGEHPAQVAASAPVAAKATPVEASRAANPPGKQLAVFYGVNLRESYDAKTGRRCFPDGDDIRVGKGSKLATTRCEVSRSQDVSVCAYYVADPRMPELAGRLIEVRATLYGLDTEAKKMGYLDAFEKKYVPLLAFPENTLGSDDVSICEPGGVTCDPAMVLLLLDGFSPRVSLISLAVTRAAKAVIKSQEEAAGSAALR